MAIRSLLFPCMHARDREVQGTEAAVAVRDSALLRRHQCSWLSRPSDTEASTSDPSFREDACRIDWCRRMQAEVRGAQTYGNVSRGVCRTEPLLSTIVCSPQSQSATTPHSNYAIICLLSGEEFTDLARSAPRSQSDDIAYPAQ